MSEVPAARLPLRPQLPRLPRLPIDPATAASSGRAEDRSAATLRTTPPSRLTAEEEKFPEMECPRNKIIFV